MSGDIVCKCKPRQIEIIHYKCNHSAFSGYRRTSSDYSMVRCQKCGSMWRTKAAYVDGAPMAPADWAHHPHPARNDP